MKTVAMSSRFASALMLGAFLATFASVAAADSIRLTVQTRDTKTGVPVSTERELDPERTMIVVIDMWDRHWCKTHSARDANLIPRLNKTLAAARKLGIRVVMAPSDITDFYKDYPQRKAMLAVPDRPLPQKVDFSPPPEPAGADRCECGPEPRCHSSGVWTRQHPDIVIAENDFIGDTNNADELLRLCVDRDVDTLIYCGVASNICVCHRSFGMFNMRRHGLQTLFCRDLVEAITANGVDPATGERDPSFTPAKGSHRTEVYLEQHVSPSLASGQLIDAAGMGDDDPRPHAVFVIADDEYESERTLPAFAKEFLEPAIRCTFLNASLNDRNDVPGLEAVYDADVVVMAMRRRLLPAPQMDLLERYIRQGRPLVALRASAAAFAEGSGEKRTADGQVEWRNFDREVLGCQYDTYDPAARETGSDVWVAAGADDHPLLHGVKDASFHTPAWIYRVAPLAEDAKVILQGKWSDDQPSQPVAWTRPLEAGTLFYTSLGHPRDFEIPAFTQMLANAIQQAVAKPVPQDAAQVSR